MNSFGNNVRVRVTEAGPLLGKAGTIVRLCMGDNAAWVKMDEDLPHDLRAFWPPDERANNIKLHPEQCEKA
jgi:hypothetical protein